VIKLYKRLTDGRLDYHEAWLDEGIITEHWGTVGDRGQTQEHELAASDQEFDEGEALERVLSSALEAGFTSIAEEAHHFLIVEYAINDMGTAEDVEKLGRLQTHLDEALGWAGLGHCDGNSIGSGSMEICSLVVDYELALPVVEACLRDTEFADYSRIHREESKENPFAHLYPDDADGQTLASIAASGSDMSVPMPIDFTIVAPDEARATAIAAALAKAGYASTELEPPSDEDDGVDWTVLIRHTTVATYEEVLRAQAELTELAEPHGGHCDGWGSFGNAPD
jgi:regulator of RNase E activity RraB